MIGKTKKLPKAPLQEVIFELLWDVDFDQHGDLVDLDFELAQGVFAREISGEFPTRKRAIPEGIPIKIYPNAIHQFWKGPGAWPVVQIGPGVLAVNDTEVNYEWDSKFFPLVKRSIAHLEKSYEKELNYINVSLRYIDAIEIDDDDQSDFLNFINSKFKIKLSYDFEIPGSISNLNLTQTFSIDDETKISLIISNGKNKLNKPALIWQTYIFCKTKKTSTGVIDWVEGAHSLTSKTFVDILNSEFYDSFK